MPNIGKVHQIHADHAQPVDETQAVPEAVEEEIGVETEEEEEEEEEDEPAPRKRRPRARAAEEADSEEEEEVPINLAPLKRGLKNLKQLCTVAIEANNAYKEAVVATSKKAGLRHVVVKAYVNALVMDKYKDMQQKAEQLSLLFDEGV